MNYTIKNDYYTAIISDVGAELLSLKDRNGKEHLWIPSADNKVWTHPAAFLYPICSRLVDNCYYYEGKRYEMAMHGFIKDTVMQKLMMHFLSLKTLGKMREDAAQRLGLK